MTQWNKCPGCGTTISSVADYCPNCGEPWTIKCPECNRTWRFWISHKFCPNCGAKVENRSVSQGKQRIVPESGKTRAEPVKERRKG